MNTHPIQLNVPLNFHQLVEIARQLSSKEKFYLSGILWDETEETSIQISEAHRQEVRKRLEKMENNPEECLSWDDIETKR